MNTDYIVECAREGFAQAMAEQFPGSEAPRELRAVLELMYGQGFIEGLKHGTSAAMNDSRKMVREAFQDFLPPEDL